MLWISPLHLQMYFFVFIPCKHPVYLVYDHFQAKTSGGNIKMMYMKNNRISYFPFRYMNFPGVFLDRINPYAELKIQTIKDACTCRSFPVSSISVEGKTWSGIVLRELPTFCLFCNWIGTSFYIAKRKQRKYIWFREGRRTKCVVVFAMFMSISIYIFA